LIKVENRKEPGLKEALDLMVGGFDKIANSGLLGDGLKGNWSNAYKDLDYVRDQIHEVKKREDKVDWKKPTQEVVATMEALATLGFGAVQNITYVQNHPDLKNLLDICATTINAASKAVNVAWKVADYGLALEAAMENPAAAVGAAFAGPELAKYGIDFIRKVAPSLDTDEETKKIENNVFGMVGGGAAGGASIGGAIGVIGGPPGMAIGAALGGLAGSVIGAVGFAFG